MRAEVRFDSARKIVERKIDKGEFITREEYAAMSQLPNEPISQ
jgi:(2Fe-2S) ferredoxin